MLANSRYAGDIADIDMDAIPGVFMAKGADADGTWFSTTPVIDVMPDRSVSNAMAEIMERSGRDASSEHMTYRYSGVLHLCATHHPGQRVVFVKPFTTNAKSLDAIVFTLKNAPEFLHVTGDTEFSLPIDVDDETVVLKAKSVIRCPNAFCDVPWNNDIRLFVHRNPDVSAFDDKA